MFRTGRNPVPDAGSDPDGSSPQGTENARPQATAQSFQAGNASADRENRMMEQKKSPGVDTILGEDTFFVGKIESRGTLRIDGRVEGEIVAQDTIIIGPSGVVKADIRTATLSVSGQVDGNIKATQKAEFHPTATVNGDVQTAVGALTIEPGAKINGHFIMADERSASPQQPRPPQGNAPAGAPAAPPAGPTSAQQQIRLSEGEASGAAGTPPVQRRK